MLKVHLIIEITQSTIVHIVSINNLLQQITNIELCLTFNELSQSKQCKIVNIDISCMFINVKLVYPCASKTFKVLSYCFVSMYRRKLLSNVTQCILLITRFT